MAASPTRKTSEQDLAAFNQAWRDSPLYQQAIRSVGQDPTKPIKLNERAAKAIEALLREHGVDIPSGMKIDNAGNWNQTNETWKRTGRVSAIAGAGALAILTAGAASPLVAAALGGIEGAGIGYGATGTGKGALIGAATGAATGGVLHGGGGVGGANSSVSAVHAGNAGINSAMGAGAGAGAGVTAAGTAGAVGGTAKWLTPLLSYGVPAATGLIGARMQANAERDAAALQDEQFDKAIAFEKEERDYQHGVADEKKTYDRGQYADYIGRLKPFNAAGTAATDRASALLTTSRYRPELTGAPSGRLVQMRAPDGSMGQVPETLVDHYLKNGAQRV